MKKSSIVGLFFGFGLIYMAIWLRGDVRAFVNIESILIVLGGTLSATIFSFNSSQFISALKAVRVVFVGKSLPPDDLIPTMVDIIRQARIQGVAAITLPDDKSEQVKFLKKAVSLLEDGFEPETAAEILKAESDAIAIRYRMSERLFNVMGSYSPLFGLLGTLIGLIIMLSSVSDPKAIPGAMAVALTTTFYGVLFSALVFRPVGTKIRAWNYDEMLLRELIIETLVSISEGINSQVAQERLESYFKIKRPA